MNEITDISRWLYTTLGDLEGPQGVYNATLPPDATDPAILFQYQGGADAPAFGPGPRLAETTWVVRATGATTDATALESLATAIDDALEKAVAAATWTDLGVNIVGVVRESPFVLVEVVDGVEYRHLGGTYAIKAQGA